MKTRTVEKASSTDGCLLRERQKLKICLATVRGNDEDCVFARQKRYLQYRREHALRIR